MIAARTAANYELIEAGVDGIFRFRIDGGADRGLAVLQVGQDGFNIVDPAPASFIAPGF